MKELSIEEKAKAYDELFVKAQQIYNKENDVLILHTIEDFFPELKESEDERIRKAIKYCIKQGFIGHGRIENVIADDCLAWLEKQGEQNPDWSEEDDQYLLVCKNALAKYQTTDKWDAHIISHWLENKLKSLRPQNRWKPSDEQMLAVNTAIKVLGKGTLNGKQLIELQEQLKRLKEE